MRRNALTMTHVPSHVMKAACLLLLCALALCADSRVSHYALILQDAPVAEQITSRKDLRTTAAEDRQHKIETAQSVVVGELRKRGLRSTGAIQLLLNAVFVEADSTQVNTLRSLPGVVQVLQLGKM